MQTSFSISLALPQQSEVSRSLIDRHNGMYFPGWAEGTLLAPLVFMYTEPPNFILSRLEFPWRFCCARRWVFIRTVRVFFGGAFAMRQRSEIPRYTHRHRPPDLPKKEHLRRQSLPFKRKHTTTHSLSSFDDQALFICFSCRISSHFRSSTANIEERHLYIFFTETKRSLYPQAIHFSIRKSCLKQPTIEIRARKKTCELSPHFTPIPTLKTLNIQRQFAHLANK